MSYATKVNLGTVKKKLNTKTLTIEEIKLYILALVTMEVTSTPKMYTVIIFASVNPSFEKAKPISVAKSRISTLFAVSSKEMEKETSFFAFFARYKLPDDTFGMMWISRLGATAVSFSVKVGLLKSGGVWRCFAQRQFLRRRKDGQTPQFDRKHPRHKPFLWSRPTARQGVYWSASGFYPPRP